MPVRWHIIGGALGRSHAWHWMTEVLNSDDDLSSGSNWPGIPWMLISYSQQPGECTESPTRLVFTTTAVSWLQPLFRVSVRVWSKQNCRIPKQTSYAFSTEVNAWIWFAWLLFKWLTLQIRLILLSNVQNTNVHFRIMQCKLLQSVCQMCKYKRKMDRDGSVLIQNLYHVIRFPCVQWGKNKRRQDSNHQRAQLSSMK